MSLLDETRGPKPAGEEHIRRVTSHKSSPDRYVFTETDNTDGWIATDYTVSLER